MSLLSKPRVPVAYNKVQHAAEAMAVEEKPVERFHKCKAHQNSQKRSQVKEIRNEIIYALSFTRSVP